MRHLTCWAATRTTASANAIAPAPTALRAATGSAVLATRALRAAAFSAVLVVGALLAAVAPAAPLPYDETADAQLALQQALASARADKVPVLIVFGANWCEDCRVLDAALKTGRNAEQIAREFRLVKIDVGRFDRNLDLVRAYGDPIKKGIPAAVVLSADNQVLYATRAGELADARRMSESGIHDLFQAAVQAAARSR
jgi:protein disulfide-isomerase